MSQNAGLQKSLKPNSQQTEDQRKAAALFGLAKMCRESLDSDVMVKWLGKLSGFSALQVERGVDRLLDTEQKREMPMPAKLIAKIREANGIPAPLDAVQTIKAQAEAEWAQVLDQVKRVGSYGSPRFHPTTERVLRAMGGWSSLCETMTSANRDFKRRDFIAMWQTYHETGDAMELGAFGVQQALEDRSGNRLRNPDHRRPVPLNGFLKKLQ